MEQKTNDFACAKRVYFLPTESQDHRCCGIILSGSTSLLINTSCRLSIVTQRFGVKKGFVTWVSNIDRVVVGVCMAGHRFY